MTYKQLLEALQAIHADLLDQTATVYLGQTDEYIAVSELSITDESNDVLDEGHLVVNANF